MLGEEKLISGSVLLWSDTGVLFTDYLIHIVLPSDDPD